MEYSCWKERRQNNMGILLFVICVGFIVVLLIRDIKNKVCKIIEDKFSEIANIYMLQTEKEIEKNQGYLKREARAEAEIKLYSEYIADVTKLVNTENKKKKPETIIEEIKVKMQNLESILQDMYDELKR